MLAWWCRFYLHILPLLRQCCWHFWLLFLVAMDATLSSLKNKCLIERLLIVRLNQNLFSYGFLNREVYWQWQPGEILTGAISHSRGGLHWSYLKITPLGCPTGTILHGENEEFQSNRSDFPKISFTLNGIWRHMGALICKWKWKKWLRTRRLFSTPPPNFFYGHWWPRTSDFFVGIFGRQRDRARYLAFTVLVFF
jgi:hypothetical protein